MAYRQIAPSCDPLTQSSMSARTLNLRDYVFLYNGLRWEGNGLVVQRTGDPFTSTATLYLVVWPNR